MSTPCTSTELRADTGSSATATTRELSAMRRWRAKYSTFSELAKLTTGALTIRVDTGCSSTLSRNPAGSCTDRLAPAGSDDASALPVPSSTATYRTMRFCRADPRSRWLAVSGSSHLGMALDRPSNSSMLASSTSTASRERLSAASAPATKRVAWASLSASAAWRAFQARVPATATTAATNTAAPAQT